MKVWLATNAGELHLSLRLYLKKPLKWNKDQRYWLDQHDQVICRGRVEKMMVGNPRITELPGHGTKGLLSVDVVMR